MHIFIKSQLELNSPILAPTVYLALVKSFLPLAQDISYWLHAHPSSQKMQHI